MSNSRARNNGNRELFLEKVGDRFNIPTGCDTSFREVRKALEKEIISIALEVAEGNRTQTARLLGISRRTILSKLKEHEL